MNIDEKKPEPKYLQVKEIIQQYFKDEFYEAGQRIPSEAELMRHFDVSRNTVRQALAELVEVIAKIPIIYPDQEAFFHARFFLEMAVKYGKELEYPPNLWPSG